MTILALRLTPAKLEQEEEKKKKKFLIFVNIPFAYRNQMVSTSESKYYLNFQQPDQ